MFNKLAFLTQSFFRYTVQMIDCENLSSFNVYLVYETREIVSVTLIFMIAIKSSSYYDLFHQLDRSFIEPKDYIQSTQIST